MYVLIKIGTRLFVALPGSSVKYTNKLQLSKTFHTYEDAMENRRPHCEYAVSVESCMPSPGQRLR